MTPAEMIRAILKRPGMTQERLAERFAVTQPTIHRWLNGAEPGGRHWAEIRAVFEEPKGSAREDRAAINAVVGSKLPDGAPFSVKLFGHAVAGVDGEFVLNGNSDLGSILVPPNISGIFGAYAVTVAGDSMSPRYEDGEIVVVDPNRRVFRGDYVVVQVQLEEHGEKLAYIKRFVRHNAEELVLEQFNPPKELRFRHSTVESVHYVTLSGNLPRA